MWGSTRGSIGGVSIPRGIRIKQQMFQIPHSQVPEQRRRSIMVADRIDLRTRADDEGS
jgi:hypothetical protein